MTEKFTRGILIPCFLLELLYFVEVIEGMPLLHRFVAVVFHILYDLLHLNADYQPNME